MYTPKDYRGTIPLNAIPTKVGKGKYQFIKRNALRCKYCGDVIESKHQHDFVECACKRCFVDGGLCYIRIGGEPHGYAVLTEIGTANEQEYEEWRKAHVLLEDFKLKRAAQITEKLLLSYQQKQ